MDLLLFLVLMHLNMKTIGKNYITPIFIKQTEIERNTPYFLVPFVMFINILFFTFWFFASILITIMFYTFELFDYITIEKNNGRN